MLNKAILVGRLTADPELKQTGNGVSVVSFALAISRAYSGKSGERVTDFINCVAWRNTAEFVAKYFRKGNMIAIDGSIQMRDYTDKDGNKRRVYEVIADSAHFVESKGAANASAGSSFESASMPAANVSYSSGMAEDFEEIDTDEDLPF